MTPAQQEHFETMARALKQGITLHTYGFDTLSGAGTQPVYFTTNKSEDDAKTQLQQKYGLIVVKLTKHVIFYPDGTVEEVNE